MIGKILQIVYLMVTSLVFCSQSLAVVQTENGYQLKFNYTDYPKEQEIAYQYYLDHETKSVYIPVPKENIGVDMFDIDGDGIQEIFLFVNGKIDGKQYCPRCGCPFAVIKPTNDIKKYKIIGWGAHNKSMLALYEGDDPKILYSKTLDVHDILISENDPLYLTIWFWNGKYYDAKAIDQNHKFQTINNNQGL